MTLGLARDWIDRLGGRPAQPASFAASDVLAIGHFHFDGLADEIEAPPLPCHYVSVTLGGPLKIEARLGGAKVTAHVRPGQSMIMAAGRSNSWRWDRPTEEAHIFLSPTYLADVAADLGNGRADISDRMAFSDASLRQTILALREELARFGGLPMFLDMAAYSVARRLLRHCDGNKTKAVSGDAFLNARQLRRVLAYVDDQLGENIGLDDLARAAGVSRFHFCRAFKATTGASPGRWLSGLRIERAKKLLISRLAPMSEIAWSVGFESQSHFGMVFQSHTGMTPSAWRRRALS
jgi:AraC family transcriptional regulator